jgi:aminoglycoside 3-N-acetyltransferase I
VIEMRTRRLTAADRGLARSLFAVMAGVFEEQCEQLSDTYLDRLLSRADFWAIAAFAGNDIIGGVTAHTLPMTRMESSEVFIYDIAVRESYQRRGVGRQLMAALREGVAAAGVEDVFVPADNEDRHALDFYRALGGVESPVTLFTFSDRTE